MAKSEKKEPHNPFEKKSWIAWNSAIKAMLGVSVGLALWVGWQVAATEGVWMGIVWGVIFGGSLWLVFFGMNLFHRLFGRKPQK